MTVRYYLTRPQSETETAIFARVCYSANGKNYRPKFYLPESILPKFWNKDTQRAKTTQKFVEHPEFNARLNNIEATIKTVFRKYVNDNGGAMPNEKTLKT